MTRETIINSFTNLVDHLETYDRDVLKDELENITIDVENLHKTARVEHKMELRDELAQVIDKIQKSDFYLLLSEAENPSNEIEISPPLSVTIDIS